MNRPGARHPACICPNVSPEAELATTAPGASTGSISANVACFTATRSGTFSCTNPAPSTASAAEP
jgi:hypothetical protein